MVTATEVPPAIQDPQVLLEVSVVPVFLKKEIGDWMDCLDYPVLEDPKVSLDLTASPDKKGCREMLHSEPKESTEDRVVPELTAFLVPEDFRDLQVCNL